MAFTLCFVNSASHNYFLTSPHSRREDPFVSYQATPITTLILSNGITSLLHGSWPMPVITKTNFLQNKKIDQSVGEWVTVHRATLGTREPKRISKPL